MAPGASGDKWGYGISDERERELEAMLTAWEATPTEQREERKGPFDFKPGTERVRMTGADVFRLAARALAQQEEKGTGGEAIANAKTRLRRASAMPLFAGDIRLDTLHLEGVYLRKAHLEDAYLREAYLERADLLGAHLEGADLRETHLEQALLWDAQVERADLRNAHLERANLQEAHLEGADLWGAYLNQAGMREAHLEGARLQEVQLGGTILRSAHLEGADLREVVLDAMTGLIDATLTGARVADVRWGEANLTVVDWELLPEFGDEREARAWKPTLEGRTREQQAKERAQQERERLDTFKAAVRANRQLATVLQDQGMSEEAANYAERAQRLQRRVLLLQGKRGRAAWSWFLDALAGYGYRPGRTVFWYLASVAVFGVLYFLASRGLITFGLKPSQFTSLPWYEALVLSVSSFHGRGFFQPAQSLGDPVAILAALEAVVGLLIEVSFIATFTQRFFSSR